MISTSSVENSPTRDVNKWSGTEYPKLKKNNIL
jgi:hypothetical protein